MAKLEICVFRLAGNVLVVWVRYKMHGPFMFYDDLSLRAKRIKREKEMQRKRLI